MWRGRSFRSGSGNGDHRREIAVIDAVVVEEPKPEAMVAVADVSRCPREINSRRNDVPAGEALWWPRSPSRRCWRSGSFPRRGLRSDAAPPRGAPTVVAGSAPHNRGDARCRRRRRFPRTTHRSDATADITATSEKAALDADYGIVEPVNVSDALAYSPTFASVGSAIFYHEESGDHSALMKADTDRDGAILRITSIVDDHSHNFHARPSPDGQRIAFDSDRDGERGVYVAEADGQNVRRISGDGFAAIPSWSPDGSTLAFVRAEPDHPKVWNLWITNLAHRRTAPVDLV